MMIVKEGSSTNYPPRKNYLQKRKSMTKTCLENFFPSNSCSILESLFSSGMSPLLSCLCKTKSEMLSEISAALLGPTTPVVLDNSCYKKLLPEVTRKLNEYLFAMKKIQVTSYRVSTK